MSDPNTQVLCAFVVPKFGNIWHVGMPNEHLHLYSSSNSTEKVNDNDITVVGTSSLSLFLWLCNYGVTHLSSHCVCLASYIRGHISTLHTKRDVTFFSTKKNTVIKTITPLGVKLRANCSRPQCHYYGMKIIIRILRNWLALMEQRAPKRVKRMEGRGLPVQ